MSELLEIAVNDPSAAAVGAGVSPQLETGRKVYIETYGCQMNVLEAQKIKGDLVRKGYVPANSEFESDIVIFNTCSVRETAERKIYGKIGEIKKRGKSHVRIAVGGCVPQVDGERIFRKYEFIDIVFGSRNKSKLSDLLQIPGRIHHDPI